MESSSGAPVPKHLGRNVPLNFPEICQRQHRLLMEDRSLGRFRSTGDYQHIYGKVLDALGHRESAEEVVLTIGREIEEVEVRFRVIQKTIDMSVPTKPVYDAINSLQAKLKRTISELEDTDRNEAVRLLRDEPGDNRPRDTFNAFLSANLLAERISVAQAMIIKFSEDINEVAGFFDYKRGLATKGNPSRYATLYAVHALADLFERHNRSGFKANVGETVNTGSLFDHHISNNSRRYTGPFLAMVNAFIDGIDRVLIAGRNREGFQDSVRKLAQGRRKDPELFRLLHGATSVENVLDFMRRADVVK